MGTRQVESLVRERCRSGRLTVRKTLDLFHRLLSSMNPAPSINSFNFLLSSLVRMQGLNTHYPTVLSLFDRLARPHPRAISPNVCTYSICIDCCARVNQLDLAFALLGRLLKQRIRADPMVFTPLLKGLCRDNQITEAAAMVFDKMSKLGCLPNLFSYNTLIKGYCSVGKTSFAIDLLEKMITGHGEFGPNVITYGTVIDGLCKEGAVSKAFDLFEQMHSLGVSPNTVTYATLINGLCKQGAIEKALKLLDYMASKGLEPEVVTYTTLVSGLCKKGLLENPGKLLQFIISKGRKLDVVTYNAVINAHCKKLLDDMISRGVKPNVVTYNTLIDGHCKMNKLGSAKKWLDDMISRGVQPDIVTYNTLIDGHCKMGELENAKKYLNEMVCKGISPDIVMSTIVVDAFCTSDVMNILDDMVLNHGAPHHSNYISLIKAYVKRRNVNEAMCVLKRMRELGLILDLDAYTPLREMLVKMGRVDDAKDLIGQINEKSDD